MKTHLRLEEYMYSCSERFSIPGVGFVEAVTTTTCNCAHTSYNCYRWLVPVALDLDLCATQRRCEERGGGGGSRGDGFGLHALSSWSIRRETAWLSSFESCTTMRRTLLLEAFKLRNPEASRARRKLLDFFQYYPSAPYGGVQ